MYSDHLNQYIDIPLPFGLLVKHFTPDEFKFAIQKYSLKKSPGYELITTQFRKPICFPIFFLLRAYTSFTFLLKILERLILKIIFPYICASYMLPNNLFVFHGSHSTTYLLHKLDDALSLSLESKKYYSCVFLNIFCAFFRLWHTGLGTQLRELMI